MKGIILTISSILACIVLNAQVEPDIVNTSGMSAQYAGGYLAWSVGEPVIGSITSTNASINQGFLQSWEQRQKTLMLTLWLEGLWNGSNLNKAQDENGDHFIENKADDINVLLYNATNYQLVYSSEDNSLSTMGKVELTLQPNYSATYYLAITHRNHLETWSSNPVSFAGDTIAYDFTTSATKAYGDNQKQVSQGKFAIMVGDVNQDGVVDISDLVAMDADLTTGTVAYIVYDLNGDGVVDISDLVKIDENLTNGAVVITP
jgi:hypothetical protein